MIRTADAPCPHLSRREIVGAALFGCVVAVVMAWPLLLGPGRRMPEGSMDSLYGAWQVGWLGHAGTHDPSHFFDANIFWPLRNIYPTAGDALLGYLPLTVVGNGAVATLVKYNVVFLLASAVAYLGAYLLARELSLGRLSSRIAGVAFAYAPWRIAHLSHINVLSSGGIPFSIFLFVRGTRRAQPVTIVVGWLVAAWQLSVSFNLGLQLAYVLVLLIPALLVWGYRRQEPELLSRLVPAYALGAILFAVLSLLYVRPYLHSIDRFPQVHRTEFEIASLSPTPKGFLSAPEGDLVWGNATRRFRDSLRSQEQALFPGLTIVLLAMLGLGTRLFSARRRLLLGVATAVAAVLSFGLHPSLGKVGSLLPYRLLHDFAPGYEQVRTPGRLNVLTSLGLALLASGGMAALLRSVEARGRVAVLSVSAVGLCAILLEGYADVPYPKVPRVPQGQVGLPGGIMHLPADHRERDSLYMYWSTEDFVPIVNGRAVFNVRSYQRLITQVESFPDARSVELLRARGVRTVVLHRDFAPGTPWEHSGQRSLGGLAVSREVRGELLIYRLADKAT